MDRVVVQIVGSVWEIMWVGWRIRGVVDPKKEPFKALKSCINTGTNFDNSRLHLFLEPGVRRIKVRKRH